MPRSVVGQALKNVAAQNGVTNLRIRCGLGQQSFTATLFNNPSVRDFASILPVDLTIEDYADNEKIAYLPRKLTEDGSGPFSDEAPGDVCYYGPWGNLAFFYGSYHFSRGLIRLGRLDDGIQPLLTKGKFPLRIELLS
nr:cyclophilin-like fold protein [Bradyrhizobium icense]